MCFNKNVGEIGPFHQHFLSSIFCNVIHSFFCAESFCLYLWQKKNGKKFERKSVGKIGSRKRRDFEPTLSLTYQTYFNKVLLFLNLQGRSLKNPPERRLSALKPFQERKGQLSNVVEDNQKNSPKKVFKS